MDPQELLERLPLVTYMFDPERGPVYVSPQVEAVFGFAPEQIVGHLGFWRSRIHEEDRERVYGDLDELIANGWFSSEYRVHDKDDRPHWVRDTGSFVDGLVHGYLVEITREKELEAELLRERATLDAFFNESSIGLAITDSQGRYIRINEALASLNRVPVEETIGKRLSEIAPEIATAVDPLRERTDAEETFFLEIPLRDRYAMLTYFPFTVDGERHHGRVVVDLTEPHRAELAERRMRGLLEQLPLVAYVNEVASGRRARYVTPRIEELTGYSAEEFIADPELGDKLIHPDDLQEVVALEELTRESHEPFELEYRIVRKDGAVRWVTDRMEAIYDDAGTPQFEQGFLVDVTESHETTSLLRAVWDSAHEAIVIADDDGRYVDVNPAACALFGRPRGEILERKVWEMTTGASPESFEAFREQGDGRRPGSVVTPDGEIREIEVSARANVLPGRHLAVIRDVTERRRLEQQLWRAQKLESVGRLAGGVAQDFNNLLTTIRGYAQLLQARTAPGSAEQHHAREIDVAADRAAALTAQLLSLGRQQMLQARPVNLNKTLEQMHDELAGLVGSGVDLVYDLEPALCPVNVDRGVVMHVTHNLVANAAEAMPHGGTVVVSTAVEEIEGRDDLPDGRYAVVRVRDDGVGIDPAHFDHVFEPFFTTKGPGEGGGLGLASAYGMIRQSGGTITVESALGKGASFSIYLPEAGPDCECAVASGRGETLLVVERDPAVRDVLFELLTAAGYRVIPARTAHDARLLALRDDLPIDLVVADLDDDGTSRLAADLAVARPSLSVVRIEKPFSDRRLQHAVCAGLGASE